ncbi:MAG TPA: glutamine synthetase family protein [Armatimonadota bacterium]|nr:glutamine synthetase family protein [Armatimonadota bacterium]
MTSNADWVWKQIQDNDVKFVKLWFTDILGFLKSFSIPVEELDKAMGEGIGFDGSSIKGFTRIDESDMVAVPDTSTFAILPWRPRERAVARMFCDILNPDRTPYEGDPRQVLKRNLRKAREMGFTFYVGPEAEYFYFRSPQEPEPLDQGGYFDLIPRDEAVDLRRETVLALEEMGIYVEYSHHEVAPSQHEIDLRYTDALTMADTLMTYRLTVKEVAYMNGVYATFMPKPLFGQNGSGMHVHQSLFRGEQNAFFDLDGPYHLSEVGRHYIAGILTYVPEFTAVTNQWVNSYKRLVPGFEAPVYISWAQRNRSNLVRIPMYKPGKEDATRIELRSPDPACNPYLAFSVMLAAGLRGVEDGLDCPPPLEMDLYQLTQAERDAQGIATLPGSLYEALCRCEQSAVVREALGEHVFREFIANKRIEWDRYRAHVTDYELKEYLPLL